MEVRAGRLRGAVHGTPGAAALGALLAVAVVLVQPAVLHEYPFGDVSRNFDDYFAQFLPFHAMLRELLHGNPAIGWQFNWIVGLGQPFLPDYAAYLGGPWSLLIGFFPLERVELGLFVIVLVKVAVVAAAMVVYLRIAHGAGHPLLAAVLGTAYATSGFVLEEGLFNPMWLDGVAALPLFALVGHWCRTGRHLVPSIGLVALFFWANFYSAVMAAVGAVFLTVVMALVDRRPARALALQLGRFAVRGALGVGISLPVVLPGVLAGLKSPPLDLTYGPANVPLSSYLSRLFSLTELLDYSPGLGVGTVALVAAAAFFAHRQVPVRERVAFGTALVVMVATMAWQVTRPLWYGFTEPHGSYFRNAFVVSALLIVLAWRFLLRLRRPFAGSAAAIGGAAVLAILLVLIVVGRRGPHHAWSTEVTMVMVLATVALVAVVTWRPGLHRVVTGLLAVLLVLESGLNAVVVEQLRSAARTPQGSWAAHAERDLALVEQHRADGNGWPPYRLDAAIFVYGNQSGLLGEPGPRYYSSTFSADSAQAFIDLGVPSRMNGRLIGDVDKDPTLYPLLSVSGRLIHSGPDGAELATYEAYPLVRVAPPAHAPAVGVAPVFAHRDALYDESVYSPPVWTMGPEPGTVLAAGEQVRLAGSCPVGAVLQVEGPALGEPLPDQVLAPQALAIDADGGFDLVWTAQQPDRELDPASFACYDAVRAATLVAAAGQGAPQVEVQGRRLEATWDRPVSGEVIVSTTAHDGWTCRVDGAPAPIVPRQGMLSLPVSGAEHLSCRYTTPGLVPGLAAAGLSLLLAAGLVVLRRRGQNDD